MDQNSAPQDHDEEQATPIFSAYRRGYDPEQVDRYVADQQRRLDEATTRASEAERRLAAAVGQLRELHRRVAVLESEDRSPQTPALDTLGERVQRILQEAWEGAYALRQGAEQEVGELRAQATAEAEQIVEAARNKARALDEATERRRQAFLERMEEDRNRALAQIAYLHDQRRLALEELVKVKEVIEETVAGARFPAAEAPPADEAAPAGDDAEVAQLLAEIGPDAFLGDAVAPLEAGPAPNDAFAGAAAAAAEPAAAPPAPDQAAAARPAAPQPADDAAGDTGVWAEPSGEGAVETAAEPAGDETVEPDAGRGWADWGGADDRDDPRPTLPVEHLGTRDARRRPAGGVFDFEAEQPS